MLSFLKKASIALTCMLISATSAYPVDGPWRGELNLGAAKLPLVFNFSETADGKTVCTIDSPAQGAKGIPAEVAYCSADSVAVVCSPIGAKYTGRVSSGGIHGEFSQMGQSFTLNLLPDLPIAERRPQTPKPPFPYTTTDTAFYSPDGTRLAATLTMPLSPSSAKIPAVVMVTGSGAQNRDEEILDHRPFAVLADFLARNGIASLRYDDRGTAASDGNFAESTTLTFKNDAKSGISFLRGIGSIGRVGVLGHSEGGTIAFMLGAESATDFIVSLSGMAVTGRETLMAQNSHALDLAGIPEEMKGNCLEAIGAYFDAVASQAAEGKSSPVNIDAIIKDKGPEVPTSVIASLRSAEKTRTPWFDQFLTLDPQTSLKVVKCPLLAIYGRLDTQVDAERNSAAVKKLVPDAQVSVISSLNHLLQTAVTGEPSEYDEITETISPQALHLILDFIRQQ